MAAWDDVIDFDNVMAYGAERMAQAAPVAR